MFDVKGKAAIVTGGAQGLGKEFCQRLLKAGAKVCVADVDVATAEKTYKELAEKYGKENVTFAK
jgi:NAD(P)-dependent dehydrogenase (short-subunit alcohol dehydrogenase family)